MAGTSGFSIHQAKKYQGQQFWRSFDAIPPLLQPPQRHLAAPAWVYFDLETTGFGHYAHITQLAAVGPMGTFSEYVMPGKPITSDAAEATRITLEDGVLKYEGTAVDALQPYQALKKFFDFLGEEKVMLVGHNVIKFDSQVLFQASEKLKLGDVLEKHVAGFLDTLVMFRALKPDLERHKQEFLVKHFLNESYNAHNALGDVEALKKLTETVFPNLQPCTLSMEYLQYQGKVADNKASLKILEYQKVISNNMLNKIAESGLNLNHLHIAYHKDATNGISVLFRELTEEGKPRVTSKENIIQAVTEYLKNNSDTGPSQQAKEQQKHEAQTTFKDKVADNKASLKILKDQEVISNYMLKKIAESGLNLNHLYIAHHKNPTKGINDLFREPTEEGKPRVTNYKDIIQAVTEYLKNNPDTGPSQQAKEQEKHKAHTTFKYKVAENKASLKILKDQKVISNYMLNKIGESGLHLNHLCIAYHKDATKGISDLFTELTEEGKPRVTSKDNIIQAVTEYMKNNPETGPSEPAKEQQKHEA